ncbi:hypothetical protein [Salipaludibacillus sp. CF4.18]|uniref:hypothetical protein n=1 Tax=Salipaludibacillus sp. CF4.18 TaxID=3373081 RepID=UPI003EE63F80
MYDTQMKLPHYPDLHFVNYCCNIYGINRGVYNVIDQWFFDKGIVTIVERREIIITFLKRVHFDTYPVRFGHGGLKDALVNFYEKYNFQTANTI